MFSSTDFGMAWISNYILYKIMNEFNHPCPNPILLIKVASLFFYSYNHAERQQN